MRVEVEVNEATSDHSTEEAHCHPQSMLWSWPTLETSDAIVVGDDG